MERYELATLSTTMGAAAKLGARLRDFCTAGDARGRFLGAWASDIGPLNRVFVLRGFDTAADATAERLRTLSSADPFGAGEFLTGLSLDTLAPFPGLPPVEPGAFGPIYEIRSYLLKTGGLAPTLEGWAEALPGRTKLSKLLLATHAVDGPPRIVHIWPYASLEERSRLRAESVRIGVWPPRSAVWLTPAMESTIGLPLDVSPLT